MHQRGTHFLQGEGRHDSTRNDTAQSSSRISPPNPNAGTDIPGLDDTQRSPETKRTTTEANVHLSRPPVEDRTHQALLPQLARLHRLLGSRALSRKAREVYHRPPLPRFQRVSRPIPSALATAGRRHGALTPVQPILRRSTVHTLPVFSADVALSIALDAQSVAGQIGVTCRGASLKVCACRLSHALRTRYRGTRVPFTAAGTPLWHPCTPPSQPSRPGHHTLSAAGPPTGPLPQTRLRSLSDARHAWHPHPCAPPNTLHGTLPAPASP